jgi:hypothetical protein
LRRLITVELFLRSFDVECERMRRVLVMKGSMVSGTSTATVEAVQADTEPVRFVYRIEAPCAVFAVH